MRRTRLAVTLGDSSGIGPEVAVKLLAQVGTTTSADVVLIADPVALAEGEAVAALQVATHPLTTWSDSIPAGKVGLLTRDWLGGKAAARGVVDSRSGTGALRALEEAADAAQQGMLDGIVFAPLNKAALRLGGLEEEDELRHLKNRLHVPGFVSEFNVTDALWTSRVTSHVPLREVADLLSVQTIVQAVEIAHRYLQASGITAPRIAVAGLNPHAGDNGTIGEEEIHIIAPAVIAAKEKGYAATGPWPADTVFVGANAGRFDAIVTMYHDQGQIAMKLMGFERGITVLGGLPVPICTCASGSAFDIAGQGIARVSGMQAAFDLCLKMATARGSSAHSA